MLPLVVKMAQLPPGAAPTAPFEKRMKCLEQLWGWLIAHSISFQP